MRFHSTPSKRNRYLVLIPVAMLIFAMLACNDILYPPPLVDRVEAQADDAGHAYARVINVGLTYQSPDPKDATTVIYETTDSGVTWHRAEHTFAETVHNKYAFEQYSDTLHLNGRSIWVYPRSIFRGIFYDNTTQDASNQFALPYSDISNSEVLGKLYIALGTQGVLVGKLDENGIAPGWVLSAKGMDALMPLPLTISDPGTILGIIITILIVPPFALIHAYLLQRVWVYLLPSAEAKTMARKVTAGLALLAVIGIVFWLTNDRTDLYQVLGVLTLITVIVGVTVTVLLAQEADVTNYTRNRLVLAAVLVSLIVPGGVAAIFAMWWLVFGVVFAYWAYQRVYLHYLGAQSPTAEGRQIRWWADRLTLETIGILTLCFIGLAVFVYFGTLTFDAIHWRPLSNFFILPALIVFFGLIYFCLKAYANRRIIPFLQAHTEATPAIDIHYPNHRLMRRITLSSLLWLILTIVATGATFAGQAMAYSWFTSLLKTKPIP